MRKLKLDLDDLAIESFETTGPEDSDGTVIANQHRFWSVSCFGTCRTCGTCRGTFRCNYTLCVYDRTCWHCVRPIETRFQFVDSCGFTCQERYSCAGGYTCDLQTCFNTCTCAVAVCAPVPP